MLMLLLQTNLRNDKKPPSITVNNITQCVFRVKPFKRCSGLDAMLKSQKTICLRQQWGCYGGSGDGEGGGGHQGLASRLMKMHVLSLPSTCSRGENTVNLVWQ